jgi:hypothetical protein
MNENEIFGLALGLAGTPWQVMEVALDPEAGRLDIHLDFPPRSRFLHPEGGEPLGVYDTRERVWRHLNFFQYECYLHAPVPRVDGGAQRGGRRHPAAGEPGVPRAAQGHPLPVAEEHGKPERRTVGAAGTAVGLPQTQDGARLRIPGRF